MARSSQRVGMFSSKRGRSAKKVLYALGFVGMALFFGNGLLSDPAEQPTTDSEYESLSWGSSDENESTVTAPIARPFARPLAGGVAQADSGDIYGNAVERPADDSAAPADTNSDAPSDDESDAEELQRSEAYQSAVQVTLGFAEAFGTYTHEQTAQDWVGALPDLSSTAEERLLASAEETWPKLEDRAVSSEASADTQSVTPIYSREGGARLQLSVTVTKETTFEGEPSYAMQSYAVTLERQPGSSGGWEVVAVE